MSIKIRRYKGTQWAVDIRLCRPDGTRVRDRKTSPFPDLPNTQKWAEERMMHLMASSTPKEMTFGAFWPRYVSDHIQGDKLSHSHAKNLESVYRRHFRRTFNVAGVPVSIEKLPLASIDASVVAAFKSSFGPRSAKTINNVLGYLRGALNRAHEWGLAPQPPKFREIKYQRREMPYYTFEQLDNLIRIARGLKPRHLAMVVLGADAGLRAGEMVALTWDKVDLERRVVIVGRSETKGVESGTKGKRSRTVPLTSRAVEALTRLKVVSAGRGRVFVSKESTANQDTFKWWMRQIEKVGKLPITGRIHILRHTFCSHLAMRGASARQIQELAGHQSVTTSERYMHLHPDYNRKTIDLLEPGSK